MEIHIPKIISIRRVEFTDGSPFLFECTMGDDSIWRCDKNGMNWEQRQPSREFLQARLQESLIRNADPKDLSASQKKHAEKFNEEGGDAPKEDE